jgi:molecular chaperone DnaJ
LGIIREVKDYYQTLGVSKNASDDEIKSAYRTLAKKYHPDVNPGDTKAEEMFKEVSSAYAVLSDREKRNAYDNGAMNEHGDVQQQDPFANFRHDFFNPFGHIYEPRKINPNSNIEATLVIDPVDSFTEQSKKIEYQRLKFCDDCNGEGGKEGKTTCPNCQGRKFSSQQINQHTIIQSPCERCQQRGFIFNQVCKSCHGFGVKEEQTSYEIKIPVGSYFKKLRIAGGGQHTNANHPVGDLFINILPPNQYKGFQFTSDYVVYKEILIDPIEAIAGVEKEVEDIKGEKCILSVPAGCQEKQILRIEGHGLMTGDKKRGVFAIVVKYDYNITRTDEQKNILREYVNTKKKKR